MIFFFSFNEGGAGGKGTWGAPGDELFEDGHCRDMKDPNYDSESEVSFQLAHLLLNLLVSALHLSVVFNNLLNDQICLDFV